MSDLESTLNSNLATISNWFSRNLLTLRASAGEWGRLGNEGRPILLKIGTHTYREDLCDIPKFQLH